MHFLSVLALFCAFFFAAKIACRKSTHLHRIVQNAQKALLCNTSFGCTPFACHRRSSSNRGETSQKGRLQSEEPNFGGSQDRVVSKRVCSLDPENWNKGTKTERRTPKSGNEGTKNRTMVTNTGTRAHSPKPPFYKTALCFLLENMPAGRKSIPCTLR